MIHSFANLILAGSAVYHLIMGIACISGTSFISKATNSLYRLQLPDQWDPRLEYAIKPLGAFAVWTSCICALSFFHRDEAWVFWVKVFLALLFVLRAAFRWFDRELFLKAFGVPWERSRWNVLFNLLLSAALLASAWSSQ